MGRREQRDELQSTWTVLEPVVSGTPFWRKDIEDAAARNEADRARERGGVLVTDRIAAEPTLSRRTYLPALARAAQHTPTEAVQVPMRE
jgi:hypothetical protein